MTTLIRQIPFPLEASLDRLLRQLFVSRLRRLSGGHLVLEEAPYRYEFGEPENRADSNDPLHAHVVVHDARMYRTIAAGGTVGAAESYIDGMWSCDDLISLFRLLTRNAGVVDQMDGATAWLPKLRYRMQHWLRKNTKKNSRRNIYDHYDLGNEFFALFLDDTMTYSAGIFATPETTMREASLAKLDRICQKLCLGPSDRVLEIGSGWGSFALHAASHYGCHVTTTTISESQYSAVCAKVREAGLGHRITVLCSDYRDLAGTYDKLVSIEMIEAVGHEYYETFFARCSERLADHGMMLIQAITMGDQRYAKARRDIDFIRQYIFPGSVIPSTTVLLGAVTRATDMRLFHFEDITPHYAETLARWRARFHESSDKVRQLGFDNRFLRLWDFYLAYCQAGFVERYIGDVQMLFTKPQCRRPSIVPPLR